MKWTKEGHSSSCMRGLTIFGHGKLLFSSASPKLGLLSQNHRKSGLRKPRGHRIPLPIYSLGKLRSEGVDFTGGGDGITNSCKITEEIIGPRG